MNKNNILRLLFVLWLLGLMATPLWGNDYFIRLASVTAMYAALTLSWNFIGGFAGYPSLSTAAFFGLGGYAGAISQTAGFPLIAAWLIATIFVAAIAFIVGVIVLRLRGHYFAIASYALVEIARLVVSSSDRLTGGGDGLNVPLINGSPRFVADLFLAVMVAIMLVVFAVTAVVDRNRLGFGLRCIQQNENAAGMAGVDATRYKVIAYTLSAMFCGTVGAAYASWTGYIDPSDSFSVLMTIKVPVMCLLGGPGTLFGPIIGSTAFVLLQEFFWDNFINYNSAILGGVIVIITFFIPGGLLNLSFTRAARESKLFRRKRPA